MIINRSGIILALENLSFELNKSGKKRTADYFCKKTELILSSSSEEDIKHVCQELLSSGAISQYADFSYKEDKLFDVIFEEINKILNSNDCNN